MGTVHQSFRLTATRLLSHRRSLWVHRTRLVPRMRGNRGRLARCQHLGVHLVLVPPSNEVFLTITKGERAPLLLDSFLHIPEVFQYRPPAGLVYIISSGRSLANLWNTKGNSRALFRILQDVVGFPDNLHGPLQPSSRPYVPELRNRWLWTTPLTSNRRI